MNVLTVPVTAIANDASGNPVPGAIFAFQLVHKDAAGKILPVTEIYGGFVVPELIEAVADESGQAVVNLFPNTLGQKGSQYLVVATNPEDDSVFINGLATVPNAPSVLHTIMETLPVPALSAAEAAVLDAQLASVDAGTQALEAKASKDAALLSEQAAATSAQQAAASSQSSGVSMQASIDAAADAHTQAVAADTSAGNARTSELNAQASEAAAGGSAGSAAASAASAIDSKNAAAVSAGAASDAKVAAESARTDAQTAKAASETAAAAAAGSLDAVAASAQDAENSADTASTKAGQAAVSATNADTSAKAAAASALAADSSSDTAYGFADNASASAAAAAVSKTVAQTAADAAALSKTGSDTARTGAETAQAGAAASRDAAAGSAAQAGGSATRAAASEGNAAASAVSAGSSAGLALAIYGTSAGLNAAQQIMLGYANTANGAVSQAQAAAAAAKSVAQQDLSGATLAALHRSPNPVVQAIVYDTSKDYLGGAWREQCAHLSWMNEALNGNWLTTASPNGFQSELAARATGATLGTELNPSASKDLSVGWTAGGNASIAGGKVTATATVGGGATLASAAAAVPAANTLYLVTVTVDACPAGSQFSANISGANSAVWSGTGTFVDVVAVTNVGTPLSIVGRLGGALAGTVISSISCKPITAFNTKSGDYYPSATDGKFYSLFRNVLTNSVLQGGTDGTMGSGAAAPTGWTFGVGTGAFSSAPSARYPGGNQIRFTAAAQRPYFSQSVPVVTGETFVMSCYVETLTSGAATIADVLSCANITETTRTYRRNGAGVASTTAIAAGDFIEIIITAGSTGNALTRYGLGASVVFTGDVTLSPPQMEFVASQGVLASAYEAKPVGSGQRSVETFTGNTNKHPRLTADVAEAGRVVRYALDQPGRPMWKVFATGAGNLLSTGAITSIAATNGWLLVGQAGTGLRLINFIAESQSGAITNGGHFQYLGTLAQRNAGAGFALTAATQAIVSGQVNAVAVMTRPTSPADPVTGLPIPTIGVAVGTGNAGNIGSVIMDDGSVVNYSQAGQDGRAVSFTSRGDVVWSYAGNGFVVAVPLQTASVANLGAVSGIRTYTSNSVPVAGGAASNTRKAMAAGQLLAAYTNNGGNVVGLIRENPSTPAAGLAAQITGTYNSGWMPGDIRRAMFIDTVVGVASGAEKILNGTFDVDASNWSSIGGGAISSVGGVLNVTGGGAFSGARQAAIATVPGCAYVLTAQAAQNTANGNAVVNVANTLSGAVQATTASATLTTLTIPFVAASTVTNVDLTISNAAATGTALFDNISLKEQAADRSAKAKNATINGTLTRTAVAAASQMVAWGGFSNDPTNNNELVTNGTFNVDTTGWGTTGGTLSVVAGRLRATNTTGATGSCRPYQAITCVVGRKYVASMDLFPTSSGSGSNLAVGTGAGFSSVVSSATANTTRTDTITFTATQTTMYVYSGNSLLAGETADIDNVSVKPADAIGSAANVAQEPWSLDHDPALAAFGGSAWFNVPATGFGPANFIRNSTFTGDALTDAQSNAGTVNGVTTAVLGFGTEGGLRYVDVQVSGTPTANGTTVFAWGSAASRISATAGQVIAAQLCMSVVSGSFANIVNPRMEITDYDSSGTPVSASGVNFTNAGGPVNTNRYTMTRAASHPATATCALRAFHLDYTTGNPVNVTMRIAAPQLERAAPTPFTATTGTAYNGIAPIYDRSAPTGAYYRWGVDANGMLACELSDGTTVRRVTTTQAVNTGTWVKGEWAYVPNGANTTLTLKVNGVPQTPLTFAALGTLSNAAALMTWGNARTLDAAFPGTLAMVKPYMTIPTAEQSTWMYAQELPMFRAGAQVTLADTGNLLDMAYDAQENSLTVASATAKSKFVGLVRVQSETPTAGSFATVGHGSSVKLLSRTGTNPGVDLSMPAWNLLSEMFNTTLDASVLAGKERPFDYDALAGQTDFALPDGWEIVRVSTGTGPKREGATKDWIRLFDGFKETVRFAVAPGAGVWVQIIARRAGQ